jgi:hypothetical protein
MMDLLIDLLNIAIACWAIGYGVWHWRRWHRRADLLWCATGAFVIVIIAANFLTRYVVSDASIGPISMAAIRQILDSLGVLAWIGVALWMYIFKRA